MNKMAKQVYIVAITGWDSFSLKTACLSEATARVKFEELKQQMIREEEESIEFCKNETDTTEELRDWSIAHHKETIEMLRPIQYPGKGMGQDAPVVYIHELLD